MPKSGIFRMLGYKHSVETKAKISKANKGRNTTPMTTEIKQKISNTLTGRTLTAEHIANAAAGHIGIKFSKEAKARMSVAQLKLNKVNSAESRLKMSKAKTGLKWFNNGLETKMCFPGKEPAGFVAGRKLGEII